MKPRLMDLFSGAGGAAKGYMDAGFHVTGVDLAPQPRYIGDAFHQADALEFLADHWQEYDVIHASPPCQGYSIMNNLPWLKDREYPLLILPLMEMLEGIGKPYVVENVMGARHGAKGLSKRGLETHGLKAGWLCGGMFGLPFYRHRLFATNWFWLAPGHPKHTQLQGMPGAPKPRGSWEGKFEEQHPGESKQAERHPNPVKGNGAQAAGVGVGHAKGWRLAAEAMGIDWCNRAELTQAIPPAFTKFIGTGLMAEVDTILAPSIICTTKTN